MWRALTAAGALALGIGLSSTRVGIWLPFVLVMLLFIGIFTGLKIGSRSFSKSFLLLLLWVTAGAAAGEARYRSLKPQGMAHDFSGRVDFQGRVRSFPQMGSFGTSAVVDVDAVREATGWRSTRAAIRLRFDGEVPSRGERIQALAEVRPVRNLGILGEYNRELHEHAQGIGFSGYVAKRHWRSLQAPGRGARLLSHVRATVEAAAHRNLQDEKSGLFKALILGDRSGMPRELLDAWRMAGVTHLVAISGLHLSIVFVMVAFAVRSVLLRFEWVLYRCDVGWVSRVAALFPVGFYALLAGAQPPTLRAFTMLAVTVVAVGLGARVRAQQALGGAALVLLALDPALLASPGFQLSFAAVFAAIAWSGRRPAVVNESRLRRSGHWSRGAALSSFVATLWTFPLTTFHFGQVSLAGLVANLPMIPFVSLILTPMAFVLGILSLFEFEPSVFWWLWGQGAWLANESARFFAGLPGAALDLRLEAGEAALIATALLAITLSFRTPSRKVRMTGGVACLAALIALGYWEFSVRSPHEDLQVEVLSVGQGDAILLSRNGRRVLVDTGGFPTWGSEASDGVYGRILAPYFTAKRIRSLDKVILSHPHQDHIGGAVDLMAGMKVGELVLADRASYERRNPAVLAAARDASIPVVEWAAGEEYEWESVRIEVLHPPKGMALTGLGVNDRSLVLQLTTETGACLLLAGDAEKTAEDLILKSRKLSACGLLKAGHHGSRTSSSQPFLAQINPTDVIVSAGFRNAFKHPHAEAIQRFTDIDSRVHTTSHLGTITAIARDNEWHIQAHRQKAGKPTCDALYAFLSFHICDWFGAD